MHLPIISLEFWNLNLYPKHEFPIDEETKSLQPKHLDAFYILGESMVFCTYLLTCQDWMKVDINNNKPMKKIGLHWIILLLLLYINIDQIHCYALIFNFQIVSISFLFTCLKCK